MKNNNFKYVQKIILLLFFSTKFAFAAPEEIQVYNDDKEAPGEISIDWHNNYSFSGRSKPSYAGEQAPNHMYRLTPEVNYGLTNTLESGFYLLTSRNANGDYDVDGFKARLKYIAPHSDQGIYYGLNFETGLQSLSVAPYSKNAELKMILGWNVDNWHIAVNLNTDGSFNSGSPDPTEDFDIKVNYQITKETQIGIESYNQLGTYNKPFQNFSSNSKAIYAVIDTNVAGHDLNFGIGHASDNPDDHWVAKFILNTKF